MTMLTTTASGFAQLTPTLHRLSVTQYLRMSELGIFNHEDRTELIDGLLFTKMTQHPPHSFALMVLSEQLRALRPPGYCCREQLPLLLSTSVPEPDFAIVRGAIQMFATRHPNASEVGLLVEVSDTTLGTDQQDKLRAYARDAIAQYWIVNIVQRQVEVYSQPSGAVHNPGFASVQIFPVGTQVPVVLDGVALGFVAVDQLLV
jgi:hypothetical protein